MSQDSFSIKRSLTNPLSSAPKAAPVPSTPGFFPPLQHRSSEPMLTQMMRRQSMGPFFNKESPPPAQIPVVTFKSEDYELGKCIGQGSSALVYTAIHTPTNLNVAIKMIDLDKFERNQIDELRREIQIMSLSKHPNLLPVYGSFVNGSKLYIITPLLTAGSCLDIMKTSYKEGLEEVVIATILKQALLGLEYLHKTGLIHRDVKAGNLLVDNDGLVQLADFGVSSSLMETGERKGTRKTFVGTPSWMSPEVMEQSGYDYKADIWSFGITAIELATGSAPYAKYPPIKVLMLTLQNDPPTLDRINQKYKYSKTFKDMIDSCLQKDPNKRPSAEKLLQHSFFKQAKKPSYLVNAILDTLPSLENRDRKLKERPQNDAEERGVSWDFTDHEKDLEQIGLGMENEFNRRDIMTKKLEKIEKKGSSIRFSIPAEESSPEESELQSSFVSVNSQESSNQSQQGMLSDSVKSTLPLKVQKGRFSVMDTGASNSSIASEPNPPEVLPKSDNLNESAGPSTLERKMGRFAIQTTSTTQPDAPVAALSESSRSLSKEELLSKPVSRFKKSNDEIALEATPSQTAAADTRGRFHISPFEKQLGTIDSESILASLKDPTLGMDMSLSIEERYSILVGHSQKQRTTISLLVQLLKDNGIQFEK